jgi:CheY-like chemotaxis protein
MMPMMMTTAAIPLRPEEPWRPIAYITLQDASVRARIARVLERAGWAVTALPTGFHLIQAIAGLIEGQLPCLQPGLVVIDVRSRGCAGSAIAAGLRDLGITIPIVLVAAPGEELPVLADDMLRVIDAARAEQAVTELANRLLQPAVEHPLPAT